MNKVSLSVKFNTSNSKESIEDLLKEIEGRIVSSPGFIDHLFRFDIEEIESKGRIRVFEIALDDVLDNLYCGRKTYTFNNKEYSVKMSAQRYFMFKENSCCVCCGLKGTRMFLEYHPYDMTPHFNLYGESDEGLILMTKDHILAKALGGEDRHSNYQTMCAVCNGLKGHTSLTLESLKTLRKFFDDNKTNMTRKQIHCALEECKKQLRKKDRKPRKNLKKDCVVLNCDLACFLDKKGAIYGRHIYDKCSDARVGCIKKGTTLDPILEYRGEVICSLGERDSVRIPKQNLSNSQ